MWPGRRWQNSAGVESAIRAAESVQVDTISVVARNHDLVLWSRVEDYQPAWLQELLYVQRGFFEYGGILFIYPLEELPYWRAIMARQTPWRERISRDYSHLITHVHSRIDQEGPLASRDFKDRQRVAGGYNTVKDTTHALDYLWVTGQTMIHSRRGFDRLYDLSERLQSPNPSPVTLEQAEYYFAQKALRDCGLASATELSRRLNNMIVRRPPELKTWLQKMVAEGQAGRAMQEGRKEVLYFPYQDLAIIQALAQGSCPPEWQPLATSTLQEVNFVAPLDNVIWDRSRLKLLFDYDYVWEVYKPAPLRRWGYYTMPVLYGDRFVARLDPRFDRKSGLLTVAGFWLDDQQLNDNEQFWQALAAGLHRFAFFHSAKNLDASMITSPRLKNYL